MIAAALYGGHDATLCVMNHEGRVYNFEFERYFSERYFRLPLNVRPSICVAIDEALDIAADGEVPEVCYFQMMGRRPKWMAYLKDLWPDCKFVWMPHHPSHAAGAYIQSGMHERACVVSYDGGGPDEDSANEEIQSSFKIFECSYSDSGSLRVDLKREYPWNLGVGYGMLGWHLDTIKKHGGDHRREFLKFAGKIMGLASYADPDHEATILCHKALCSEYANTQPESSLLKDLPDLPDEVLASSMQQAFLEVVAMHVPSNLPIIMTGGCALNVVANSMVRADFVPPNPGDQGIPFGMLCLAGHITEPVDDLQYSGWPILDKPPAGGRIIETPELAAMLSDGKVIGVMRGRSEHGPRALGNRSILCDPSAKMKDHLNKSVKFREFFRPYAPVVRQDNAERLFEGCAHSPYMSYSPPVLDGRRDEVGPSAVHIDGTSRVQTVTHSQNPWLYGLLQEFEAVSGGRKCLLNTSFNVRGRPILTRCSDALQVLKETALDAVLIGGRIYE